MAIAAVVRELVARPDVAFVVSYRILSEGEAELAQVGGAVHQSRLEPAPGLIKRVVQDGGLLPAGLPEVAELRARGAPCTAAFGVGVAAGEELLGALVVGSTAGGHLEPLAGVLNTVSDLLASSLANAERYATTFAEARRDTLTGLGNHRAFHEHLDAVLASSAAEEREAALVLFDLDDFKRINDTHGHPEGDRVLRLVSRIALRTLRPGAEVFRVGGEEFAIVVDGDCASGVHVAEQVRAAVAASQRVILPTLSAGVAGFPQDAAAKGELVDRADVALYVAKRRGKNRVIPYSTSLDKPVEPAGDEHGRRTLTDLLGNEAIRSIVLAEIAAVTESAGVLALQPTPEAVLDVACRQVADLAHAAASVAWRNRDGELTAEAHFARLPFRDTQPSSVRALADSPHASAAMVEGRAASFSAASPGLGRAEAELLEAVGMESALAVGLRVRGEVWGVIEVYERNDRTFTHTEVCLAELAVGQVAAVLSQFTHAEQLRSLYRDTLVSLSTALEVRHGGTASHADRVARLCVEVGQGLGLTAHELGSLEVGALLHDVGLLSVPGEVLGKPGALAEAELRVLHEHPRSGSAMLEAFPALAEVVPIVRHCHERFDGGGYPDRLAGTQIPLGARIVAVCEAYLAMQEARPHRASRHAAEALAEARAGAGTQFDPRCVSALVDVLERDRP